MIRTRKLKIIVIVLIVLSVSILPMAFSVSYAKWTGGSGSISGTVNIFGGGTIAGGFTPDKFPEGFHGGVLVKDENGNAVLPERSNGSLAGDEFNLGGYMEGYSVYGSGEIYNGLGNSKTYFQFFRLKDNGEIDTTPVTLPLGDRTAHGIEHEENSPWYVLPGNHWYSMGIRTIADGTEVIDIWY